MFSQLTLNLAVVGSSLVVAGATLAEEYVVSVGGQVAAVAPESGTRPVPTAPAATPSPASTMSTSLATPERGSGAPPTSSVSPRPLNPPSPVEPASRMKINTPAAAVGSPSPSSPSPPASPLPDQLAAPSATFGISSFNVLGSSHTARGGKHARMATGSERIRTVAALLDIHGVDVVGFQELQGDQYRSFRGVVGGAFDVFPGASAGPLGFENSIAWRTSVWSLQQAATVQVPYFEGRLRPMPYVLLQHNVTGRRAWFANFHNPASTPRRGNNDRHRARATFIEVGLVNRLRNETGYPVFVTGDMNEREIYFCRMTGGAAMVAANGGSNDDGCRPPPYPMPIDWIFGSDMVTFTNYRRDEGPLVRRTSDHPMILATATLDGDDGVPDAG